MKEIIDRIVDESNFLEIMPDYGRALVVGLARFGGYPCGIVASQSMAGGGILENHSACKAARFITTCDSFQIPLLFLQDVPGFMVGSFAERSGIIKDGAKMLYAVSRASVPKITIVIRKAYGAGYFVMCGRGYEPDYLAAWPTAEIALMGAEGAVSILHGKKLKNLPAAEMQKEKGRLEAEYRGQVSALQAARFFGIDDIIDPRETARIVHRVIELAWHKEVEKPFARHGIFPV
jgi:acetyl-CoA carboxylase carboxyltransferase component